MSHGHSRVSSQLQWGFSVETAAVSHDSPSSMAMFRWIVRSLESSYSDFPPAAADGAAGGSGSFLFTPVAGTLEAVDSSFFVSCSCCCCCCCCCSAAKEM